MAKKTIESSSGVNKRVMLKATSREEKNGKSKKIRTDGYIPAVVYGSKTKNMNIKIKKLDFKKAFEVAGEFNLIDLTVDNKEPVRVIIKDVQKNNIKNDFIHADLYRVDMTKKIVAEIPLNLIGESKAVKESGATLVKNMDNIKVECLPGDLISHIDIDLSNLNNIGDYIRLQDLKLPEGIKLVSETNEAVVGIMETKVEEVPVEKPAEEAIPGEVKEAEGEEKIEAGKEEKAEKNIEEKK